MPKYEKEQEVNNDEVRKKFSFSHFFIIDAILNYKQQRNKKKYH